MWYAEMLIMGWLFAATGARATERAAGESDASSGQWSTVAVLRVYGEAEVLPRKHVFTGPGFVSVGDSVHVLRGHAVLCLGGSDCTKDIKALEGIRVPEPTMRCHMPESMLTRLKQFVSSARGIMFGPRVDEGSDAVRRSDPSELWPDSLTFAPTSTIEFSMPPADSCQEIILVRDFGDSWSASTGIDLSVRSVIVRSGTCSASAEYIGGPGKYKWTPKCEERTFGWAHFTVATQDSIDALVQSLASPKALSGYPDSALAVQLALESRRVIVR